MVLAYLSQDKEYLSFVTNPNKDLHSLIASFIYPELEGLSLMEIKKQHADKRQASKGATFAIAYGGNGYTISVNLGLSLEKGEEVYQKYLKYFSGLSKYWNSVKSKTLDDGFITVSKITGRKSFFHYSDQYRAVKERLESAVTGNKSGKQFQGLSNEFWEIYKHHKTNSTEEFATIYKPLIQKYFRFRSQMERNALNTPVQGLSAEMSKLAGIKMFDYIIKNNLFNIWKICIPLHDEWAIEVPISQETEGANQLQKSMEDAAEFFCPGMGIKASPKITKYWDH